DALLEFHEVADGLELALAELRVRVRSELGEDALRLHREVIRCAGRVGNGWGCRGGFRHGASLSRGTDMPAGRRSADRKSAGRESGPQRRASSIPRVASTPKRTPQRMIEMTCQKATTLRFAPKPTIADEVICEGRSVWPSSETPGTPNLSHMRFSRCRRGSSSSSSFCGALSRMAPAPERKASIEMTWPITAIRMAMTGCMPSAAPMTEPK